MLYAKYCSQEYKMIINVFIDSMPKNNNKKST